MSSGTLEGKVAIVTGAGRGIGLASALLFAREGARIGVLDVDGDAAGSAAEQIGWEGGVAVAVEADVSDAEQAEEAVDKVVASFGSLDVLINNAGVFRVRHLLETTVQDWDWTMATNARGVFLMTRAAAPRMRPGSAIVNLASAAAVIGVPETAAYAAAKGAVVSLTRAAAVDLAPAIRVNCVCPGTIRSPMAEDLLRGRGGGDLEAGARLTARRYLLERLGEPEEIARVALFLAGPGSSFLTGAVISADGGLTAQ